MKFAIVPAGLFLPMDAADFSQKKLLGLKLKFINSDPKKLPMKF